GAEVFSFFAFDPSFTGGVSVRAGDVNGDGRADVVTGAGAGGGPHVQVFSGVDLSVLQSFFAFDPSFTGGVFVGVADMDGDGRAEVVAGGVQSPFGDGSVRIFSAGTLTGTVPAANGRSVAAVRTPSGIIAILIGAAPGTGSRVQAIIPFIEQD